MMLLRSQPLILLCVWMCPRLKKWQEMIRIWGLWVFAKAVWFDYYVVSMKMNWRYNCRMVLTRNLEQMAMSWISVVLQRMRWALLSLNLFAVWCPYVTDAVVWLAGWFELQGERSPYQSFRWGRRSPLLPQTHTHTHAKSNSVALCPFAAAILSHSISVRLFSYKQHFYFILLRQAIIIALMVKNGTQQSCATHTTAALVTCVIQAKRHPEEDQLIGSNWTCKPNAMHNCASMVFLINKLL